MAATLLVALMVLSSASSQTEAPGGCTEEQVNGCTQPYREYIENLDDGSKDKIVPDHDEHTMRNICRNYAVMESCLQPLKIICDTPQTQIVLKAIGALEGGMGYLCNESLDDYVKHVSCFSDPARTPVINRCRYEQNERLILITQDKGLSKQDRQFKTCETYSTLTSCVIKAYSDCPAPEEASALIKKIVQRTLSAALMGTGYECKINSSSDSNTTRICPFLVTLIFARGFFSFSWAV